VRIEVAVEAVRGRAHLPWLSREWVRITVRDHGIGMGKAALRRIFREFYRGPEALERNISGVGLGLALCRHVVRAHGGRIAVQSSPGEGSAFSVFLPAAREGG
jgi:two-component system phosphate regulon sensor histidine kinase PhoR